MPDDFLGNRLNPGDYVLFVKRDRLVAGVACFNEAQSSCSIFSPSYRYELHDFSFSLQKVWNTQSKTVRIPPPGITVPFSVNPWARKNDQVVTDIENHALQVLQFISNNPLEVYKRGRAALPKELR